MIALDAVDVDIARGRFTAVMGPSGSGKSTLMHCLAGLDTVSAGQVWLGDTEITGLKDRELTRLRRDRIGFMFQSFNLIPTLNARENITLPMDIAGRKPDEAWLDQVVDTLGLRDRLKHRPAQLSGGQQQRVACARALASRPELIFADEPTGNLDSRAGLEVLGFLREAVDRLGQTVVMVTHDPGAAAHSDLVLFLADGRIVDETHRPTAESVLERMKRFDVARATPRPRPRGTRRRAVRRAAGRADVVLKATLRSFLAHKGRLLLSALAVVLSVAFVAGSLIFSDTVSRTFDRLFASSSADVTVQPRDDLEAAVPTGAVATVPAGLARQLGGVQGVASAHPDVEVENVTVVDDRNESVGPTTGAPTLAVDWHVTERSVVELTSGRTPRGDGEAVLDADTADAKDVEIGDTLTVQAQPGSFEVEVVGIATFTTTNPGAALVFLEPEVAATRLLGAADRATSVSVEAAPGVPDAELKRRITAELGAGGYTIQTADETAETASEELGAFLDVIKYAMLGFAGIAVLVGVFLIVNTFSMLIAQRTRELGLLRALGADRRQVRRSVLTEAVLLGVAGSTVGLAAGVGLAFGLIRLMSAFGMNVRTTEMVVGWATPVSAYVVGVGVTFVAAYLPARRAASVSPMAALADAEVAGVGRPLRARAVAGGVVGALGAAALLGCVLSGETATAASLLGLGVVLTLVATVVAGPLLVRPVIRVLGAAFPRCSARWAG